MCRSNETLATPTDFRGLTPRPRLAGMHLPPFHTFGVMIQIIQALRSCITVALYPPITKRPDLLPIMPTPENVLDHLRRTKSNALITIPSNLQVWSHDPKSIDILKDLQFVVRGLFPVLELGRDFHCFLVYRYILAEQCLQNLVTCCILLG